MVVTLPCLMLLLDYWPMRRWGWNDLQERPFPQRSLGKLILEKLPLLLIALVAGSAAVRSQKEIGAMLPLSYYPLATRIPTILIGYSLYLWKMVWFANLIVFYPLQRTWISDPWPWTRWAWVAGSVAILLAFTVLAFFERRRRPWLIVGWLWFVGVLLPVSGIFQAGPQLLADRFSYLPSVGLLVMIVWSIPKPETGRYGLIGAISAAVILFLCASTWVQSTYWQDDRTVFSRALQIDDNNWLAHDQISLCLYRSGNFRAAVKECAKALALNPTDPTGNYNMGLVLSQCGQDKLAVQHYEAALVLEPNQYKVLASLAVSLQRLGDMSDAYQDFEKSIAIRPNYAVAHSNLGGLLAQVGMLEQAIPEFQLAIRLDPTDKAARLKLKYAMQQLQEKKAKKSVKIQPAVVAGTGNR